VQQMFGQNAGDEYFATRINLSDNRKDVNKRLASSLVRESETGDFILKLTNLLPVAVGAKINLADLPVADSEADLTVLQGEPTDENARPVNSKITVSPEFNYKLPAYSFSVIRIKSTFENIF